jgi:hypothetical protein
MQTQLQNNKLRINILCKDKTLEATRTSLGHLLPIFTGGIDTIFLVNDQQLPFLTDIRDHPSSTQHFFGINSIKIHTSKGESELTELLLHWLGTRRADGEPRLLAIHSFEGNPFDFLERIRQVIYSIWNTIYMYCISTIAIFHPAFPRRNQRSQLSHLDFDKRGGADIGRHPRVDNPKWQNQ